MKEKNEIYLITTDNLTDPSLPLGEAIRATTASATNFKKAYEIGLGMAGIRFPRIGYKAALNQTNKYSVVKIQCDTGSGEVVIAKIKKW